MFDFETVDEGPVGRLVRLRIDEDGNRWNWGVGFYPSDGKRTSDMTVGAVSINYRGTHVYRCSIDSGACTHHEGER